MCNRYIPPDEAEIERFWKIDRRTPARPFQNEIFPRTQGPFIRTDHFGNRELVVGQWALIPHFAKTPKLKYSTNNARSEELTQKPAYRDLWKRGQRCIIPANSFDEPCWEEGRNIWWRFHRKDGDPWGLAGLWNTWVDKATGEIFESYTMLTLNADNHPLMKRMHKPDPAYGPDEQDKRSVVPIEVENVDQWLQGTKEEAAGLVALPREEIIQAGPLF